MLHADGLRLGFAFESGLEIHMQFAVEHLFCFGDCETWTTRQPLGKLARRDPQLFAGGQHSIVQANPFGLYGGNKIQTGEKKLSGFR